MGTALRNACGSRADTAKFPSSVTWNFPRACGLESGHDASVPSIHSAMRTVARAALLLLAVIAPASAKSQQPPLLGPRDGRELPVAALDRVTVGIAAPDFTLERLGGGTVTLSQFRGKQHVVLVFYRGYWCPYCIAQLRELRSLLDADLKRDTELLVVSIDREPEMRMAVQRVASDGVQPDFTFLSDPEHAVIDRYGLLNTSGSRRGIPHPATFVIDRAGVVQWRDVQTDYKIRPPNASILAGLRAARGR